MESHLFRTQTRRAKTTTWEFESPPLRKRNMEEAMPLEPIKPFVSDKNLKRAIVISWVGTAVLTTGFLYVIAHFVAKFW